MSNYTIEKLYRHATRCGEIRSQPECPSPVAQAYDGVLQPLATQFITACDAATHHKQLAVDAKKAMDEVLAHLGPSFGAVRGAVKLHTGATVEVPPTLTEPGTETEVKLAIQKLVALVEPHRGQPWADAVLDGPFHALALDAIAKLDAYVGARRELEHAVTARGQAYDAFYAPFLVFKEVVRGSCGKSSRDYRSINLVQRGASAPATPGTTTTAKPVAPTPSAPVAAAPAPAATPAPAAAPVPAPAAAATPTNGGAGPAVPSSG